MKNLAALSILTLASGVATFPSYSSLASLSQRELDNIIPTLEGRSPPSPPGPINDTSAKLVNDAAHPWQPLQNGDIRGPCPGLNTLASHGYLPRNGIASPSQIVTAVQEGFNMAYTFALFVTYAAHLVDGNLITDLLSIGGKSPLTGSDPPAPALVGGLNTHAVFEGDSSMTRGDAFFGDNHSFNDTLFAQFEDFSNKYGGGKYNLTVAGQLRRQRVQQSIATNPNFSFVSPRYFTAYAESVFPINFFIDGRQNDGQLDMTAARSFLQDSKFPDGFFRANGVRSTNGIDAVAASFQIAPGRNLGTVNSYTPDPTSADFSTFCLLYTNFVNQTIKSLYPDPQGALRDALNANLGYFYQGVKNSGCTQLFPYGK